ncbi:hypothetical protein [Croceimicrobium hydrocarbonivorans]|uniref:Uncharacterized protein n=1 Tax=Croceimicrobium hydrocarbonivorans TaxID=2761580 RepID=A0A7H0VFN9_9FLAO|nr:hypothetical protein [Croceimicrobium hydrocarbonivorans]QNR24537.1 hypothetical protein H4K34_01470 [Croceimicrobium hydrocarbonivorans]
MGLLNLFKRSHKSSDAQADNGMLGPTYLQGFTDTIQNPKDLQSHEWRRQLKTAAGQSKFKIKYYGQLHESYQTLIVGTDFAPSLVFAVDPSNGAEILLFDACKHGYNALFSETFTEEQIKNRPVSQAYIDQDGNDTFEIVISTYNGIDYEKDFAEHVDENGLIELIDGTKLEFEEAKRNGFDTIQIWASNEKGNTIELLSEELA